MKRLCILAIVAASCEDPAPVYGQAWDVNLVYLPALYVHPGETIADAEDTLGMELIVGSTAQGHGGIYVTYLDEILDGYNGSTRITHPCAPAIWARNDPWTLAHEIGHALGLEHSDDPDNLMWPERIDGSPQLLDDDQQLQLTQMAWWMQQPQCEDHR